MTRRVPRRADHLRFCTREGWSEVRSARGRTGAHHLTSELGLIDGRILRTRISRPATTATYGPSLWAHILRDQLEVTEGEFWACAIDGVLPRRSQVAAATVAPGVLPASLAYQLVHELHLSRAEISALTVDEALALLATHWSQPPE